MLHTILSSLDTLKRSLLHLAFPHVCENCGTDLPDEEHFLCLPCLELLPCTHFHMYPNNPVEKMFWGRIPLTHATAQFYFTKHSPIQKLMHAFKYKGNKELGLYLGRMMGQQLAASNRFRFVDAVIPLPLFYAREKKRGFNQAAILCQGISEILKVPVLTNVVARTMHTESQTKKNRVQRWQNMKGRFVVKDPGLVQGKHLLLVDDVVTTGATLESCGQVLLEAGDVRVSIATLCLSSSS